MVYFQADAGSVDTIEVLGIDSGEGGGIKLRFRAPATGDSDTSATLEDQLAVTFNGEPVTDFAFQQQVSEGVNLSIVFDVSGSMNGEPLAVAKQAVTNLVDTLPANSNISLVSFGNSATLVQSASTDKQAVTSAIDSLVAGGETALYDGVITGIESQGSSENSLVLLVTDGGDTVSSNSLEDVTAQLEVSGAQVTAIALDTEEASTDTLVSLVGPTGAVLQADNTDSFGSVIASVASNISQEFEITLPAELGGSGDVGLSIATGERTFSWNRDISVSNTQVRTAAGEQPPPNIIQSEAPSSLSSPVLLYVGVGLIFAFIAAVVLAFATRERKPKVISQPRMLSTGPQESRIDAFNDLRIGAARALEEAIGEGGSGGGIAVTLERAALGMRVGEFYLMSFIAAIVGLLGGLIWKGFFFALLFGIVGFMGPRVFVSFKARQRSKAFADLLPDFLAMLANTLRAGYSLQQALVATARELDDPLSGELQRVLIESRVGGDLIKSMRAMAERIQNEDMGWVIDAIEINQTVGGDLVEVLESVGNTIRERVTLKAQVDALAAEGKMSAGVLFILPPGLAVVITVMNPDYFGGVWDNPIAYVLAGAELILLAVGGSWLWKMVKAVSP